MKAAVAAPEHRRMVAGRSLAARGLVLATLVTALLGVGALSVAVGSRAVGGEDILAALAGRVDTIEQAAVALRIPRTLLACIAGAALGLAGAVMQGVTRNPLADPGILGVNMGASFAVVIAVAVFGIASPLVRTGTAIVGAGLAAAFVYMVASLGRGGATPLKLALAGTATWISLSALTTAVILPRADIVGGFRAWQVGGVGGAQMDVVLHVLPFLAAGFAISLFSARRLNALALGDDLAAGLGEHVARARAGAALGAVLLCGATTAVCGPIGFVGLIVPHACRHLVGVDHRWLLPVSTVGGAVLLTIADIVGRIAARPMEVDVGIVTAFVGAPVFIWIVRRQRIRDL